MKPEDEAKIADMKGRGQDEKSIIAFFRLHGHSEGEIRAALESVKPAEPDEERRPLGIKAFKKSRRSKLHVFLACAFLLAFLAGMAYLAYPLLPGIPSSSQDKIVWKVSSVPLTCSPGRLVLDVKNADISGMPSTTFTIRENNASCLPPTDLQSTGIGAIITCHGEFQDGFVYTLSSPVSVDDGIVCRYQ